MGEMLAGAPFQWLQRTNFWQEIKSLAWGKKRPRSGETRQRFDPPMNEVAMRFLTTATIVGPIVLIILTIWIWFGFGTRAHGLVRSMCLYPMQSGEGRPLTPALCHLAP